MNPSQVKIYADLNCPFCFALHERLDDKPLRLEGGQTLQWCFVEHAPALNSQATSQEQSALLKHEYALVCQRAPDIHIEQPEFCTNSQLAIFSLISAGLHHPDQEQAYCNALMRAYWQHNQDISDPQILHGLLHDLQLGDLNIQDESRQIQQQWQQHWERGPFDRRIPVIERSDGEILLGLQHPDTIQDFVCNRLDSVPQQGETCLHHGDFVVATLGLQQFARRLQKLANGLYIVPFNDLNSLIDHCQKRPVDALILDFNLDHQQGYLDIRQLKEKLQTGPQLPVIYVSEYSQAHQSLANQEVQAFALGANDFAYLHDDLQPLISRLKNNLTQARTVSVLRRFAAVDGLTGLLNKREFQQTLNKEWRHAQRLQLSLALIMIDVDHFKLYNDHYGHCAGDEALRQVSQCLQEQLHRPKDILARFGGEEFVAVLPDTDRVGLETVCQTLLQHIRHLRIPHPVAPSSHHLSISLGACWCEPHADQSANMLMEKADQALYQAKESGRDQYVVSVLAAPKYQ